MTPVQAAARDQRAAAHLLELARAGERVLHIAPTHRLARQVYAEVLRAEAAAERLVTLVALAPGVLSFAGGGSLRCLGVDGLASARPGDTDLVTLGSGVELSTDALLVLALRCHSGGVRIRTAGW